MRFIIDGLISRFAEDFGLEGGTEYHRKNKINRKPRY